MQIDLNRFLSKICIYVYITPRHFAMATVYV